MDAYTQTPPSQYEYIAGMDTRNSAWIKERAYQAMEQLEGWCTQQKAAVLIDLVLMKTPKTIVEIGVFGGKSLVPMAIALKEIGKGKIYGIDPWSVNASSEGMEGANYEWWHKLDHEAILRGLLLKIYEFNLSHFVELLRCTSVDAPLIPEIDILHIDGNHSEIASYNDVVKWVPMVKRGGVIIFDDINWATTSKAVQLLNEQCVKFAEFQDTCVWGVWVKS